jgi:hypothetical protein
MQWSNPPVGGNLSAPGSSVPSGSLQNLWYVISGPLPQVWSYNGQGWQPVSGLPPLDGKTQIPGGHGRLPLQRHREAPAIHYEDSSKELVPPLMLN